MQLLTSADAFTLNSQKLPKSSTQISLGTFAAGHARTTQVVLAYTQIICMLYPTRSTGQPIGVKSLYRLVKYEATK